jgi:23S rRNA (cytosine1962-C5)-methyltransferase
VNNRRSSFVKPRTGSLEGADSSSPQGRMTPLAHEGPLPWVQLRNAQFHPSIFRKMIGRMGPTARNGDLVAVYDRDGKRFGTGLLATHSQIGLRMLSFDASEMDESFLTVRLAAAVKLRRETLRLDATTDAYRVVHAEGDQLPGLIIDKLGDRAVVELFSYPMFRRVDVLRGELKRLLGVSEVIVRADERVQEAEGFVTGGDVKGPQVHRSADRKSVVIQENGVRFQIDLTHGHKTGFFCDQRDNRLHLTTFTEGADLLDLCCYSGGFGVYAATLGKAKHVTAVDLDEDAIALALRNANLNKVERKLFETVYADSFPYLRQMQQNARQFDVIVLDPPKLIPTKEDFFEGRGKYFDLNKLAMGCVKSGGWLVTCSCSGLLSMDEFFSVLRGAARSANKRVQVVRANGPGDDHPVMTECPESSYLKCLWARVF